MRLGRYRAARTILITLFVGSCAIAQSPRVAAADKQILFVCEHGNVKSLMAMSYFNRLAGERGLPYRALSRGTAPDSTTVPAKIVEGLKKDGFDVSGFHPASLKATDISESRRVITMGVALPQDAEATKSKTEKWDDVPPAIDFNATRDSLMAHVRTLVDELAKH